MFKRGAAFYLRRSEGGKERWKSLGTDFTKALDQYHRIILGGEEAAPVPLGTIAELGERWIGTSLRTRRTEAGVRDVVTRFRTYVVPFMGHLPVDQIKPGHLREYRLHLEAQKSPRTGRAFKPETIRHFLRDMQDFCSWLEEDGYVDQSPFPRRIMPRIPDRGMERFSEGEVQRLLELPEPYRWVIRLALATGMRWGELTRVQASDLQKNGTLVVVQPKTGRAKRIPLPTDMVVEIRGRVGKLVSFSPASASSFARAVWRKTGIRSVGSRMLRHTAACRSLDGGVRLDVIKEVLGHRTIRTTERYARLGDEAVKAEMGRFWDRAVANAVADDAKSKSGNGSN